LEPKIINVPIANITASQNSRVDEKLDGRLGGERGESIRRSVKVWQTLSCDKTHHCAGCGHPRKTAQEETQGRKEAGHRDRRQRPGCTDPTAQPFGMKGATFLRKGAAAASE
jgi:hypothetical protein